MSYGTNTTILTYLPNLPQSTGANGYTRVLNLIDNHVTRADTIINSYLAERYDISGFDTSGSVPPVLRTYSEDIASYYTLRSLYGGDGQNVNEYIQEYYKAMEDLAKIRDGEMNLFDSSNSQIPAKLSSTIDLVSSNTEDYTPFFLEDGPLSWAQDEDKLDEIKDDRD